jgi:hypothetical protein
MLKQYFDINKPINAGTFSTFFVILLILGQNIRFYLPQKIHLINHILDIYLVLLPTTFLFSLIYSKRSIDITNKFSPKKLFLIFFFLISTAILSTTYTNSIVLSIYLERISSGIAASAALHNKLIIGILLQAIFALPIAILSFYLIFKKSRSTKK